MDEDVNLPKYECELVEVDEYLGMPSEKRKYGKYHATNFWDIKGFGQKKWVVGLRLRMHQHLVESHLTDTQLLEGCLRFLNTPPPKKKYAKKHPIPKYGKLTLYKGKRSHDLSDEDSIIFSVLAIVDKQKNKYFWSKGKSV